MRRVLVVGWGYLGGMVADLLNDSGWTVEGWTRTAPEAGAARNIAYPVVQVDVSSLDRVKSRGQEFELIIHCASTRGGGPDLYRKVYLDGVRHLATCFPEATLLFTSSTSVYGQDNGEWVTEESIAEPTHEGGRILRETEDLVLEQGGIVARLAGIYGPGRSALLHRLLVNDAAVTKDRYVNQVHRDDAAAAICLLVAGTVNRGEIFNVSDGDPRLLSDCYRWLAAKLARPWPAQLGNHPAPASGLRKRGASNKRVSNAKLRSIGWTPIYASFAQGMSQSVLTNGPYLFSPRPQV